MVILLSILERSESVDLHCEVRNEALFISVGYRSGFLGHWAHEDLAKEVLVLADDGRTHCSSF